MFYLDAGVGHWISAREAAPVNDMIDRARRDVQEPSGTVLCEASEPHEPDCPACLFKGACLRATMTRMY